MPDKNGMFKIGKRALLMCHHAIQISIDLIHRHLVRASVKMKGHISQAATVIYNKTFTALVNGYLFNKFGICICKTRYAFLCL